jgi:hypothetical protein
VPLAALIITGCSSPTVPEKKVAEPPPAPVTGRQAFQQTFGMGRTWSSDIQAIRVRSINLPSPKSEEGKAGAWEIVYASAAKSRARTYTWSAIESEGNLHKGVFGGQEESWTGRAQERPFYASALKIDTPEALQTAIAKSGDYLKSAKPKPQVNFMLEATPRYPNPAWRVLWGETVSGAEWSVFIDATTGAYLGR